LLLVDANVCAATGMINGISGIAGAIRMSGPAGIDFILPGG